MTETLRDTITGMLQAADPTPEAVQAVLREWDHYFKACEVRPDQEEPEFRAIMKARLGVGVLSLRGPDLETFR